ncbi:hypothetical protein MMC21_006380 [Puttea exsequens]|nr:hypothetical protein [Puttea exsequens]
MHLFSLSAIACLIAAAIAQSGKTANPPTVSSSFMVTAGKPSTFTWKPTSPGPISLTLRSGASSNLDKGTVIASGIDNTGSYTFTLPADTTRNSDYTIEISDDKVPSDVNYTGQFVVESSNTVESITPSGSAAATTATTESSKSSSTATSDSKSTSSSSSKASSSSSSAAATSAAASATAAQSSSAPAPSSNAGMQNVLSLQGGLVAIIAGVAAAL